MPFGHLTNFCNDTPSGVHPLRELKAQRKTVTLAFLFAAFKHTRERILEIVLCKVLLIRMDE